MGKAVWLACYTGPHHLFLFFWGGGWQKQSIHLLVCSLKTLSILQEEFLLNTGIETDLLVFQFKQEVSWKPLPSESTSFSCGALEFGSHFSIWKTVNAQKHKVLHPSPAYDKPTL